MSESTDSKDRSAVQLSPADAAPVEARNPLCEMAARILGIEPFPAQGRPAAGDRP